MSTAPTPPQDPGTYATYVPHDLPYSSLYEDDLLHALLHPSPTPSFPNGQNGIRILPDSSPEHPEPGISIRASDVNIQNLPRIREDELPLRLDDTRRIFASAVPGVRLTHPHGYLEGGPGLDPEMDTFSDDFFSNCAATAGSHASSPQELREAVQKEIEVNIGLLKERLRAREQAKETNEGIERRLRDLRQEHDMELRVHNKMAEERRGKREARERRKAAREGGG